MGRFVAFWNLRRIDAWGELSLYGYKRALKSLTNRNKKSLEPELDVKQ